MYDFWLLMTLTRDPGTGLWRKVCPRCGQSAATLGNECPFCGRDYSGDEPSVFDALPLIDIIDVGGGVPAMVVATVVNALIVLTVGPLVLLAAGMKRLMRAVRAR